MGLLLFLGLISGLKPYMYFLGLISGLKFRTRRRHVVLSLPPGPARADGPGHGVSRGQRDDGRRDAARAAGRLGGSMRRAKLRDSGGGGGGGCNASAGTSLSPSPGTNISTGTRISPGGSDIAAAGGRIAGETFEPGGAQTVAQPSSAQGGRAAHFYLRFWAESYGASSHRSPLYNYSFLRSSRTQGLARES
jgi:hypothetical protein